MLTVELVVAQRQGQIPDKVACGTRLGDGDHVVLQAVREGKFHIWAVKTIDEGIEILTGRSAGERDENGKFAGDTIHGLTQARLWKFMEDAAKIKKLFGVTGDDPEKEKNGDDSQ